MRKRTPFVVIGVAVLGAVLGSGTAAWAQQQTTINTPPQQPAAPPPPPAAAPPQNTQIINNPTPTPGQVAASPVVVNPAPAGEPVHYRRRPSVGLISAGATIFTVSYLITVISAAVASDVCNSDAALGCREAAWPIYVPVVGPFMQMGYLSGQGANTGRALLAIDGVLQAGGVAMFAAGLVLWGKSEAQAHYSRRFQVAPYTTAGGGGLMALGRF